MCLKRAEYPLTLENLHIDKKFCLYGLLVTVPLFVRIVDFEHLFGSVRNEIDKEIVRISSSLVWKQLERC